MENQMKEKERIQNHTYISKKSNGFNFSGVPTGSCFGVEGSSLLSLSPLLFESSQEVDIGTM